MYELFILNTSQLFEKITMHLSETNRLFVSKKNITRKENTKRKMEAGSFGETRSIEKETQQNKNLLVLYQISFLNVCYVREYGSYQCIFKCFKMPHNNSSFNLHTQIRKVFTNAESPRSLLLDNQQSFRQE